MIFKFQSDSINTPPNRCPPDAPKTLNSNLILLILMAGVVSVLTSVAFKFQSDSINTMEILQGLLFGILFKFQSDSINTLFPVEC